MLFEEIRAVLTEKGFAPQPPMDVDWVDAHGHVLSELDLMNKTPDEVREMIRKLHKPRPMPDPDDAA
jgi:hypothetical protein